MASLEIARFLTLTILALRVSQGLQVRSISIEKNMQSCEEQVKEPYFDINQVIGKSWRIYYTWNVQMDDKCLDMSIRNATAEIAQRIYNDMHEYLESQPVWDAATLFINVGKANHELLLFADQGAAGSFVGVPNVIRDGNITPIRNAVPLIKFFLKLIHGQEYLLMMDCNVNVASLMSSERKANRMEINKVAKALNLGNGTHACVSD